ncbi:MAG: hypothetical protein ACFE9Y_16380 [Promethearchaeota archaeon]
MEEESRKTDLILDYYKDWDSYKAPVMMSIDIPNDFSESLEAKDDMRLKALRLKMKKRLE